MTASAGTDLRAHLAAELTSAMRRRDQPALRVLRVTLARIANAEAVPIDRAPAAGAIEAAPLGVGAAEVARRELSAADVEALVRAEIDELETAGLQADAALLRDVLRRGSGQDVSGPPAG